MKTMKVTDPQGDEVASFRNRSELLRCMPGMARALGKPLRVVLHAVQRSDPEPFPKGLSVEVGSLLTVVTARP